MFGYDFAHLVSLVLTAVAALGGAVGLVQVLITRPDAFTAAGKLSKGAWTAILAGATLVIAAFGLMGLLGLVGAVGIIVYWVDVRPALQAVQGRGTRRDGPYGPW